MMEAVDSDADQPREIVPREPALPELNPEQRRQFDEFQRFQAYQRYVAQQAKVSDNEPVAPLDQGREHAPVTAVHKQLTGIHARLDEVLASQQRTERAVNPPVWKKLLRSRLVSWLVVLAVLIAGGIWVLQHFFGSRTQGPAATPQPVDRPGAVALGGTHPDETVIGIYHNVAAGNARDVCVVFTDAGKRQFAADNGVPTCEDAVRKLHAQVTDVTAYNNSLVSSRDVGVDDGDSYQRNSFVVTSCAAGITGGPRLGEFALVRAPNRTWIVAGHRNESCPSSPTTSTSDSESALPTG